jgi:hypothetical protein
MARKVRCDWWVGREIEPTKFLGQQTIFFKNTNVGISKFFDMGAMPVLRQLTLDNLVLKHLYFDCVDSYVDDGLIGEVIKIIEQTQLNVTLEMHSDELEILGDNKKLIDLLNRYPDRMCLLVRLIAPANIDMDEMLYLKIQDHARKPSQVRVCSTSTAVPVDMTLYEEDIPGSVYLKKVGYNAKAEKVS